MSKYSLYMITQKFSVCMGKFLGLENIFYNVCCLKLISKSHYLYLSFIIQGRSIQGNMHILNPNFRLHFGRYLLKTILYFPILYFILLIPRLMPKMRSKKSPASLFFFFSPVKVYPAKLSESWKNEHIWETYTCKGSLCQKRLTCICNACLF